MGRRSTTIPPPSRRYRFGTFELDAAKGELRRQGIRRKLHAQPFQLLVLLLEHPGEILSREEIAQELWPEGTFVDFALTKEQIADFLRDYMNVDKIIWLPLGVYEDETSGHIDNMCCFARPGEVILTWTDDEKDPQHERSKKALEVLERETDAKGRKLKINKIYQPGPLFISKEEAATIQASPDMNRAAGHRLAGSYVNFLITNGRIILPQLDPNTDADAHKQMQSIFPKHNVVGVPAREILLGGGNIHCITQQIPSGKV